eukprot:TRINITY_DN28134_c0_g1_i1.p1 TRINITY_DN28134_c0_g1~~TRINITY_DN28134_c0_g1_i1.p1  ORF type:complete len:705 (-),score=112.05 TRINITY_DN28134_c0_g1_i1:374-2488(-)
MEVSHASLHTAVEQHQTKDSQECNTKETEAQIVNPWLERYVEQWKTVQEDPEDFTTWTNLLTTAEKMNDADKVRAAFDAFLIEYPLCYGYWKKYADSEVRLGDSGRAETIYERGVASIPYSSDLWAHYAEFTAAKKEVSKEEVQSIFERGLAYVGKDFQGAHTLWDKLIEYETKLGDTVQLAATYARILKMPTKMLDRYHNSFKEYVQGRKIEQLIPEEEIERIRVKLQDKKRAEQDTCKEEDMLEEGEEIVIPDEDIMSVWVDGVEGEYGEAKKLAEERKRFEDAIRRPYFHVKSLDSAQLVNWCRYLDWVEQKDNYEETILVYERCLIACALYSDFWRRYVRFLEPRDINSAYAALKRATEVHCKRKAEIHIFASAFYERQNDLDLALQTLQHASQPLSNLQPPSVEAIQTLAAFQNRHSSQEAACEVFEKALVDQEKLLVNVDVVENGDVSSCKQYQHMQEAQQMYPFLIIQYAHYCQLILNDFQRAEDLYERGLKHLGKERALWEGAIHNQEINVAKQTDEKIKEIVCLYRRACRGDHEMSESDRYELWQRWDRTVKLTGTKEQIDECEALAAKVFPSTYRFTVEGGLGVKKRSHTEVLSQPATKVAKITSDASVLQQYSSLSSVPSVSMAQAVAAASHQATAASQYSMGYWPSVDMATQQQQQYYYGYDYSMYGYGAYGYGAQASYPQATQAGQAGYGY